MRRSLQDKYTNKPSKYEGTLDSMFQEQSNLILSVVITHNRIVSLADIGKSIAHYIHGMNVGSQRSSLGKYQLRVEKAICRCRICF